MLIQISLEQILKGNIPFHDALRWGGIHFDAINNKALIEAVEMPFSFSKPEILPSQKQEKKLNLGAMVIPTGLGCSIGGYGGDANLCANLVSKQFDYLIVNPNVVNGGSWQNLTANMLYLEGAALDLFMQSRIGLRAVKKNKIALIIDCGIPKAIIKRELEVVKAAQTIWGIDFIGYELTVEPVKQTIEILPGGFSSGNIANPEVLIEAGQKLKAKGATALAILTKLPYSQQEESQYVLGNGADPIGGLEAICSHLITLSCFLPCAHAPAFETDDEITDSIDSRVSPEICSYSFLPSVLKGLSKAPQLMKAIDLRLSDITVADLSTFIGPADCWLGESFLNAAQNKNLNVYAVLSNLTNIGLTPQLLNLSNITNCSNYLELIGHLTKDNLGFVMNRF